MRPLTAQEEATLRRIAERHGYRAQRGPHTGEGSASTLMDALLAGDVVTLSLSSDERRRLVTWLDSQPPPSGHVASILRSLATQLHATLPAMAKKAASPAQASITKTGVPTRRGHLTTEEAARRLGLSPSRVQEMARDRETGRKVKGRWVFTEGEIRRVQADRDRRELLRSFSPTRLRRRRPSSRQRSSSGSGRPTRADFEAMSVLDQLLANERRSEQMYQLPFRAPQQVATTVHTCQRCGQDLLFLIFGDRARDAEGLLAYSRLMHDAIVAHGVPAYVLGEPQGDGALDDTPSLLMQVWPEPGAVQVVTPGVWDRLLEQFSQAHCAAPLLEAPAPLDR